MAATLLTAATFAFNSTRKVTVLGSGSFGTAIATLIARNGFDTCILGRKEAQINSINDKHHNPDYLSAFELPLNLRATTSASVALKNAEFVVHCIPLQASQDFLTSIQHLVPLNAIIVSTSKGLHATTLEMMCDIIPRCLPGRPSAYLSGPSFAKELMERQPTGLMVASIDVATAQTVRTVFASDHVRVYLTTDVVGVEVGGALKNIFAIAAGALEGMGLGMNATAMLVTRGCKEMGKLAVAMGANAQTLNDLSGIGDLMLTCFGSLSRNRSVGVRLGQGETITAILASVAEVAEGVATAPAALALAQQYAVDAPIITGVAALVAGQLSARECLAFIMQQPVVDSL